MMRSFPLLVVLVVFGFLAINVKSGNPHVDYKSDFDLWINEDFEALFKNPENIYENDIIKGKSNWF